MVYSIPSLLHHRIFYSILRLKFAGPYVHQSGVGSTYGQLLIQPSSSRLDGHNKRSKLVLSGTGVGAPTVSEPDTNLFRSASLILDFLHCVEVVGTAAGSLWLPKRLPNIQRAAERSIPKLQRDARVRLFGIITFLFSQMYITYISRGPGGWWSPPHFPLFLLSSTPHPQIQEKRKKEKKMDIYVLKLMHLWCHAPSIILWSSRRTLYGLHLVHI